MGKKRGRQPTFFSISKSILGVDIIQKKALFGGGSGGGQKGPFLGGLRGSHLEGPVYK